MGGLLILMAPRPADQTLMRRDFKEVASAIAIEEVSGDPDRIRTGDLCLDRAVC